MLLLKGNIVSNGRLLYKCRCDGQKRDQTVSKHSQATSVTPWTSPFVTLLNIGDMKCDCGTLVCGGHAVCVFSNQHYFSPPLSATNSESLAHKKAPKSSFGHQLVTSHQGVNIAGTQHRGTFPHRANTDCNATTGQHTAAVHSAPTSPSRRWVSALGRAKSALALYSPTAPSALAETPFSAPRVGLINLKTTQ